MEIGKYNTSSDELAFGVLIEKLKTHEFNVSKKVDADAGLNLYDIKYYEQRFDKLELLDEGEVTIADRISILRKYVAPKTQTDTTLYDYMTKVHDITVQQKRGSIVLVHGFAQCSDVWFEMAMQMALNGYVVHCIDLEGFGYCAGSRITNLSIEKMHH